MPRIGKPEYKKEAPDYPVLIAKDLFALERELEEYKIDIPTYQGNNGVLYFGIKGMQKYFIDKKALANREDWAIKNIPLFKELQDKLEQYSKWCRRREYAQRKQLEEYEGVVDTMQIVDDDIPF